MDSAFDYGDAQPGMVLPGAAPMERQSCSVSGVGGARLGVVGAPGTSASEVGVGLGARVTYAPTERIAMNAGVAAFTYELTDPTWFPFSAGVRYIIVDLSGWRIAPYVAVAGAGYEGLGGVVAGLALEGGPAPVRVDVSISPVGLTRGPLADYNDRLLAGHWQIGPPWLALVATEIGTSVAAGPRDVVRVGIVSISPNVTWTHHAMKGIVDVSGGVAVQPGYRSALLAWFEVGARLGQ